jgi:hypothetical protein
VTVAAAHKSAAKLRRDVDKVTAELEALEQREEEALDRHQEAKAASFEHQEAMQVSNQSRSAQAVRVPVVACHSLLQHQAESLLHYYGWHWYPQVQVKPAQVTQARCSH